MFEYIDLIGPGQGDEVACPLVRKLMSHDVHDCPPDGDGGYGGDDGDDIDGNGDDGDDIDGDADDGVQDHGPQFF